MQRAKHRQLSCTWLSAVATVLASSNEEKLAQCTMELSTFLTEKITIYCLRAQDMTRIVYCTQAGIFQTPNLSVTELHRHT